ncbi:hypothetical protein KC343_g5416 [Hortaea werneckii]|uniref:BTB domain-containing protein n=1 Tax=Hortaea werneckii TaxID=91943 RepID=A0A3M7HGQ7_HORWE|nr:hypothetical protein KC352_g18504 [Hortaea werneckii]KAI7571040.1 hypothetical protein KC317_g1964 [Hortaea werneckii]KAI7619624.1 hypothetical protein KC346_g4471 [Hortaea werneckii]KAI7629117.1 hypothetical protein KC343_g5416 [Hortaea werneckii]KAI7672443.1 hypothetical protein KC319_g5301 [Hortaea werneckii]
MDEYHEDSFATVVVDVDSYKISESQFGKFRINCARFCEALEYEMEYAEGSLELYFDRGREVFELFLFWVAESRLPDLTADLRGEDQDAKDERAGKTQDTLTELWLFAEKYAIRKLQNDTMRSLLGFLGSSHIKPAQLREPLDYASVSRWENAMLLEVAYDLLQDGYTATDKEQFAELDGFFSHFITLVKGEGVLDPKKTSPSNQFADGGDISAFLVRE